jgi:hypothetical protein
LPNGLLTLEFSEMLFIPSNLTQFFIDIEQGLCLNYTPGEVWPNMQNFSFSVTKVQPTEFSIQIKFEHPEYISVSPVVPDKISVYFSNTSWMLSMNNNGLNHIVPKYQTNWISVAK